MPMTVKLRTDEIDLLNLQDFGTESDGGFQQLMVRLRCNLNQCTHQLTLSEQDLETIPRYAFDYKNGGWQNRLVGIFGRTLGSNLGRDNGA